MNTSAQCDTNIKNLINFIPNNKQLQALESFFKIFSDCTRLKIISCLSIKNLCVNDISKMLKINQTTISHQLKELKAQNIVKSERLGKMIIYSLSNSSVEDLLLIAVDTAILNKHQ